MSDIVLEFLTLLSPRILLPFGSCILYIEKQHFNIVPLTFCHLLYTDCQYIPVSVILKIYIYSDCYNREF